MNTKTLDDVTTAAVRSAWSAAAGGRISEAIRIAEEGLGSGGEPVALNAMLGTLYCRTGAFDRGIEHLRVANSGKPDDAVIALNLANALVQTQRYEEALNVATDRLAELDPTMRLLKLRAFLLQQLEDFPAATSAYERIVASNPDDVEAWNNLGNSRRGSGDIDGAIDALRRAAELDPKAAPIRLNLGGALSAAGQFDEAERLLKAMADESADDWRPLRELYLMYRRLGREEDALEAVEEASRRSPKNVELGLGVASQRLMLLDSSGAEAAYRAIIDNDPANAPASVGLAVVLDLTNRADELPALIADSEKRRVGDGALNFIRAFDHRRAKRYEEGLAALNQVPGDLEGTRRAHLYGQLSEGAGKYDQAWAAYERMNELHRADPSQPEARAASYRKLLRSRVEGLTPEWAERWRESPPSGRNRPPAFLIGFPRSGTTLLDTFLMGHPAIDVLEEEPTLVESHKLFESFDELPEATDEQIDRARERYFDFVSTRVELSNDKVLVDKNPLGTNALPLIRRMFADAPIIVALRHPCDVVLSCFATNFKLNDGTASFLRLETAAELYDLTMTNLEKIRELLPMPMHTVRYESLVADPERELRAVVEFVGLPWSESLVDHQKTARERGRIKTASYAQVVEPIYSRSSGRWRNFEKQLEPVLPILEPWIRKFGYA